MWLLLIRVLLVSSVVAKEIANDAHSRTSKEQVSELTSKRVNVVEYIRREMPSSMFQEIIGNKLERSWHS